MKLTLTSLKIGEIYSLCMTDSRRPGHPRRGRRRCRVSAAAASLALRGKPGVGEATRQRILEAAADLGYRVRPGKDTPADRDHRVAPLTTRIAGRNPDAADGPVIGAITEACADAGADVRLGTLAVDDDDEPVEVPRLTLQSDVDGFLVIGPWLSRAAADLFGGRPVVVVDGDVEDRDSCSSVVGDEAGGTAAATEHWWRPATVGSCSPARPRAPRRRSSSGGEGTRRRCSAPADDRVRRSLAGRPR